jgi:hypothetical protein
MAPTGLECVFRSGVRTRRRSRVIGRVQATLVCVDPRRYGRLAGRAYDAAAVGYRRVRTCGEAGVPHIVWDAPNLGLIGVQAGERVEREGFWFADLVPA